MSLSVRPGSWAAIKDHLPYHTTAISELAQALSFPCHTQLYIGCFGAGSHDQKKAIIISGPFEK